MNVSRDTPISFGLRTRGSSIDFGADINNELSCRKRDHLYQVAVNHVLQFRNICTRSQYGYVVRVTDPLTASVGRGISAR